MSDPSDSEPPILTPLPEPQPGIGYCLRCGSRLSVHPLGDEGPTKCPRCGLPYVPNLSETFLTRRRVLNWNLWFPGLVIAILAGVLAYAASVNRESLGYAAFFAVPFSIGLILGFATRAKFWLILLVSLLGVSVVVFVLVYQNLAGIFCGFTLGVIFLGPALLGAMLGYAVRLMSGEAAWDRRKYVFLTLFVGLPFGAERVERRFPIAHTVAEISSSATFDAPAAKVWDNILFYEQVTHAPPPLLLVVSLPRPLRAEGRKDAVGDVSRCVYNTGYLVKTITRREPPRLLAFDVTEQHLQFEQDIELIDGSFLVEPLSERQTRVFLTTRYRRLLRPAWLWEPMEREIVHTLHQHVLEGMRLRADRE